jgi:hypothetical protein
MEVEAALRTVQAQHPDAEVRMLNWHRPKPDVWTRLRTESVSTRVVV